MLILLPPGAGLASNRYASRNDVIVVLTSAVSLVVGGAAVPSATEALDSDALRNTLSLTRGDCLWLWLRVSTGTWFALSCLRRTLISAPSDAAAASP